MLIFLEYYISQIPVRQSQFLRLRGRTAAENDEVDKDEGRHCNGLSILLTPSEVEANEVATV